LTGRTRVNAKIKHKDRREANRTAWLCLETDMFIMTTVSDDRFATSIRGIFRPIHRIFFWLSLPLAGSVLQLQVLRALNSVLRWQWPKSWN